jgi:hypothetical protein
MTALPLKSSLALQGDNGEMALVNSRLSHVFNVREHDREERGEIEAFIRECFAAAHNSRIANFMPRLLSLRSRHGELIAAFGLRAALQKQLFLETYLDHPIEQVLQDRLGMDVRREEVIEVGNLSALYPGVARWLIVAITAMLHSEGYKWVVFTGTSTLRNGFHRLGLRPVELGEARLERLPVHERDNWGSYYDQAPTVMAGDIEHGYRSLLVQRDLAGLLRGSIVSVERSDRA